MKTLIKLFLLTLVVGLALTRHSNPLKAVIKEDSVESAVLCSTECTDGISNNNVLFDENRKYEYLFRGETVIIAPTGTEEGISKVSITGRATIIGTQKCGAVLYLKQIEITQGLNTYGPEVTQGLQGHAILFSYNNGKVGRNICSIPQDSTASLNLKRAILSSFQVSSIQENQKEIFETDIQGTCNTTYHSYWTSSDSQFTITKDKDLAQCSNYENINLLGLSSTPSYPINGDSPFSSAIQHSEIKIKQSKLVSVTSKEIFFYQPCSAIDVVTKIMASMSMDLIKTSAVKPLVLTRLSKSRSIVFEKPTAIIGLADADALVTATKLAFNELEPIVDMNGANSFSNLIQLIKVAKKDDILSAFNMIMSGSTKFKDAKVVEKIFIDALMAANSGESIEAIVELIDSQQLSDALTVSWFNNLANAKHPTKEAVVKASSLLDGISLQQAYIGVGALLRQYLQDTQNFSCTEVANTLDNLGKPLMKAGQGSLSADEENLIIASLKSIGYVQYINNDLEDLIIQITMDKNTIQRIKAASLAMLKVYAKNSKVEKACEQIFTDTFEDSEIRILAFKVFATNPTNHKASVIKYVLDNKNTQLQIRAYLFGYLSNLRTTADENKQDQKRFYEGILIKSSKKPLNDILRYSQNLEYYQQYPLLHSGFLLNGEVIYSYNSFLARSSSASLKAFIFGREYNMFKINFRIENLEPLLEKLFGPKGHFAKNKGSTFDNVKNYVTQAINYAKNRKQNGVDSESYSEQTCENIPEEEMKKMYIDVALTLLGNDLGWFTFQELECKITYQHIIDALLKHFDNSVTDEKNIELSIRKQLSIIDSETKYVTCSGLPFALKIHATAAIKFDIATKIDLESYFEHPENSNFTLKLVPSGSLDFNSKLIIDGHILETGYKITSSLHTSTGFDFSFETDVDKGFKFVYGLPLSVMDILTIKSEAYSIVQERGSQPIEIPLLSTDIETKSYKRTFDKFEEIIGLSFFVHYESPWNGKLKSLLPFFGRSLFSLKIIKVDTDLTKYVSIGNYDFKTQTLKYIKCIFVTPDASTKRGLELLFIYDTNEHNTFVAELKTPFTKIILLGTLVNSDEQKTIEVKYIDGPQHILSIGVKCEQVDSETIKYSPIFEAKYSTEVSDETYKHYLLSLFDIEGYVLVQCNMNPESHYPTKLTLNDIAVVTAKSRHSLQGSFTFNNNEVLGDVSLTANSLAIKMNGLLSGNYPIFKLDLNLNMIRNEQPDQQLETDESYNYYRPNSKFVALLYKVKTLNLLTSQEIHIESPYVYLSHFHIHLDDDYLKANYDILIENNEPTILVNISASNFLDEAFNVNITVLPRTVDTGLFVHGLLENSLVSDPSNSGYRDFKYVQNKNKKSSHLEFTSEYPQKFGKYQISAERQSTVDSFKYTLLYDIQNGSAFTVDIDILTNDIICNINFDSPNPEDKSYMLVHGWLKTKNTYGFDTKALWAGEQNLNYMNANGQMLLNGRQIHISGFVDYPLANLVNVHLSVKSNPDPENEDGGFATVQCTSNNQVLLSEKFKYKLILNDDEFYVSGKSIYEESQNFKPVSFEIIYKNYIDDLHFTGKQIEYKIELEQNNQQILHQKRLEVTKHVLNYRQIYKIDDKEQNIMMDLSYNITSASDWSYKLISKVNSPSIFDYLTNNDENVLEFNSYFTFGNYSLDQKHTLKMYSSQMLIDLYKFKWCTNYEKTTFKLLYNKREIRGLAHYSLDKIEGGYDMKYASRLWLNFKKEPNSESTLSINNYYTIQDGLSAGSFIKICVPLFNNKEMGIITDVQMFKSWKNPLYILLELDIFPSTEQTLKLSTSLNRDIQDNGVLYSTSLMAESKGMKLDYEINYAFYISSDKWGEYLDIRFIDSDNSVKPIQLHFELVPKGFTQKINIFDIAVVYVDSTIMVKDGVLNTRSNIRYNKRPYSFELSVNLNPSFKFIMEWEDQKGYREKLILEGSITMDESAVISATRIQNNGKDVKYVGYLTKFLDEKHWWETNNHLSSEQSNEIWKSLMGQFIELFISVNSNITTIVDVAKQQRRVRWHEAKKAQPLQYHALVNYTCNEAEQIFKEVWEDTYILQLPMLILNTTEVVFADVIKCIDHNSHYFVNSIRHLKEKMRIYLKNTYKYYSYQADILRNKLMHDIDELMDQVEFTLLDILRQLNLYTDEPVNDMQSSEPRSVKEYYDNFMNTLMKAFDEFEEVINNIKDLTENYIKSLSIYDLLHDQIENLKSYPLKENLSIKIHNYLKELEMSAPTKDFASFVNALNKYINNVMHDIPVSQREIIALRNKGFILVKSMMFNFSNYVNYDRAMAIYNALRKLFNIVQTVLYIASPNTFQYPTDENLLLSELNEYNMQFYQKYVNPLNFIPPFNAQGVIISSTYIITYNNQVYSFMPYNGCYILVEDFVNNKFSILAYYNNNVLTKLSVSTNNGEKYVIFSGGSVTVNGRNIDFPHITDNLKIWKDVYYLEIEIAVGVSIKCTLDFNIIQMFVNGYHYSYVFGLLGSMYQEPTFDFKLSNGELSEDMVSFLLAYRKMGNDEPTITDLLQTDQPLCSNLFSGNSTLRPFFKNISPIAYRTICNQIVSLTTSEQDSLDKACLVTKAFVSMIRQNFMLSCNIPDMCITTSVHERTIDATTNVKISEPNNVADVMILFEKTVKIQKVFLKILNPFIKQVTSNFNKKGINDVKFILMGYSEKSDSEVYMYTINEGEDITKILSNMPELTESQIATTDDDAGTSRLQSQFIHSFKTVIGQNSKDKAHRLSVDYPYRMNANIVVLSITQSLYDIHSSIIGLSKYTFDYILSWYIKQSISFFLIGPINLKDASDNDIFGANGANTIYSISSPNGKNHGNKYSYNASLETNLVFMEKGGIYDLQFLSQATSSQEKIFLDSLCKTIVGTSVSDSIVEKSCSSSLYKGVMPYPKCVVITA